MTPNAQKYNQWKSMQRTLQDARSNATVHKTRRERREIARAAFLLGYMVFGFLTVSMLIAEPQNPYKQNQTERINHEKQQRDY